MGQVGSNFAMLLELAKETSSEKRREFLRQITDVFLDQPSQRNDQEGAIFDDIVSIVAGDLETHVRAELSRKIASTTAPVHRTARRLAFDSIDVARPVLESSSALSQADLVEVIRERGQEHMMAVTRRSDIGEEVSSALVERGEDRVVASLLGNRTARIDRQTFERVAERAQTSKMLQAPLVRNERVPLDLLNNVYLRAEGDLRREIMQKFQGVSPSELEAALQASKKSVMAAYGAFPDDFTEAEQEIDALQARGGLRPPVLVTLLRDDKKTAFTVAFARLTEIEFSVAQRLTDALDLDALAMLCRGAGFDRGLFVTLCLLLGGKGYGLSQAERFGQLYEQVPVAAAQRALRFWKVRAKSLSEQAA
jgi:uncharacterized protein (DUF2336 family)